MSLFREQYAKYKREQRLGTVNVRADRFAVKIAIVFVLISLGFAIFIATLKYDDYLDCRGVVESGGNLRVVSSPLPESTLLEWYVGLGDAVAPGSVIAQVKAGVKQREDFIVNSLNVRAYYEPDLSSSDFAIFSIASAEGGVVYKRFINEGARVGFARPLISVGTRGGGTSVSMLVPVRAVGALAINDRFVVRSWPSGDRKVQARVVSISERPMGPVEVSALFGINPPNERQYIVSLKVEEEGRLMIGEDVAVRLVASKKSLFSWVAKFRGK